MSGARPEPAKPTTKAEAYRRQAEQCRRAIAASPAWLKDTAVPPRGRA